METSVENMHAGYIFSNTIGFHFCERQKNYADREEQFPTSLPETCIIRHII